ncbi:MAG: N-acetyltransferase family protein [Thermoleophilaceae bacterium]
MKQLADGTPVVIRSIRPDDKQLLTLGLRNLSALSVQQRFLGPKPSFSRRELSYLTEVDGHDHVALVAESPAQPVRHLIAVARFVRLPEDPQAAEAAILVVDSWQGRGLGSLLARELAARARGLGVKRFTATMASDNRPALRLMEKLAYHLERGPSQHGVSELTLDLAA